MIINYDDNISLSMVPSGKSGVPGRQTEGTFMSMISARIERLPFARFHTHLLLMGGLGYMFDAMDAAVLAFILPVLRTAWNLCERPDRRVGSRCAWKRANGRRSMRADIIDMKVPLDFRGPGAR